MRVAIIGMGNMGGKYAEMIGQGKVADMTLVAATRIKPERLEQIKDSLPKDLRIYQSGDELLNAYDNNEIDIDGVIIVTPHYSHEDIAIKAFERGLHVLCDKPAGVYSRQARNMLDAYEKAKEKDNNLLYGYIFHQRTYPVYMKIKEIIQSNKYGRIKRVNWVVTDWFRSNAYYTSSSWRATYRTDGGGTILNQCPHNLDLIAWICGMPKSIQAFCHEGKYHNIEVEDDVTAYIEWDNNVTGVFIASTGEAAGVNRLEISLEEAMIICENGKTLKVLELDKPYSEYMNGVSDMFGKPKCNLCDIQVEAPDEPYAKVLDAFTKGKVISDGVDGLNNMYFSNAIYLSSWEQKKIEIPKRNTKEELLFEKTFEEWLDRKRKI